VRLTLASCHDHLPACDLRVEAPSHGLSLGPPWFSSLSDVPFVSITPKEPLAWKPGPGADQ